MSVRDEGFWVERASTGMPDGNPNSRLVTVTSTEGAVCGEMVSLSPCHYREYWQDRYAREMRERALREMFPRVQDAVTELREKERTPNARALGVFASDARALRVLDVGCGDGRFGVWVGENFDAVVSGVDAFRWKGAYRRLTRFAVCDAEAVSQVALKWGFFDVALLVTVLPFVGDFKKVLEELTWVAPYVLVLDNLQDPAPRWQTGLRYKRHITHSELIAGAEQVGFELHGLAPVNFVDRALFVRSPKVLYPLTYAVTRALDALALWGFGRGWVKDAHVRYRAVLLRNGKWESVMERWAKRKTNA